MRSAITKIILIILFTLVIFYCLYNPYKAILRFQPSDVNKSILYSLSQSLEQHITATQIAIKNARQKAQVDATNKVVLDNSPSFVLPNCGKQTNGKFANGIVLIHGLYASPYTMHTLAKFFQEKCFVVNSILLPGHGTVPGDLLNVTRRDWMRAVDFELAKIKEKVNNVYLLGHSTGATLALDEWLDHPEGIKGLILFAPALKINSNVAFLTPVVYGASFIFPSLKWWDVQADKNTVQYESNATNSIYQIFSLMNEVNKKLQGHVMTLPLFIAQSDDDNTIDAKNTFDLFKQNKNPLSKLIWYSNKAVHFQDNRIDVVNSNVSALKILDMSHLSLMLPSNDAIYGINGSYKSCLHYKEQSQKWRQCKESKNTVWGEITDQNLKEHIVQRITFNPFYEDMLEELNKFLKKVES